MKTDYKISLYKLADNLKNFLELHDYDRAISAKRYEEAYRVGVKVWKIINPDRTGDRRSRGSVSSKRSKAVLGLILVMGLSVGLITQSWAMSEPVTTASWYSVQSCLREGTSGIMANGRALDDNALTCATWGMPFGTRLRVTNTENLKAVIVVVTDRGPNKKLWRAGRKVDLSKKAFSLISPLTKGIIPVKVEVLK